MNTVLLVASDLPTWLRAIMWASLCGTILAAAMVLCTPLLRRMPAKWRMMLWLVVLVRFVPLALPESRWSVFQWIPGAEYQSRALEVAGYGSVSNATGALENAMPPQEKAKELEIGIQQHEAGTDDQPAIAPTSSPNATTSQIQQASAPLVPPAFRASNLYSALYVVAAVVVAMRFLLATRALHKALRTATLVQDDRVRRALDSVRTAMRIRRQIPILTSSSIKTPALVGMLHPRLLLPNALASLSDEELRMVFLHECAHLLRQDVLLNYVLAALSVIHWFNPVYWLMLPRIRTERELACDELVLRYAEPIAYGHMLLKLAEDAAPARSPAAVGMIESRRSFARRIETIAAFRKAPRWATAFFALVVAGVAAFTLTSPAAPPATIAAASATDADVLPIRASFKTDTNSYGSTITAEIPFDIGDAQAFADKAIIPISKNDPEVHVIVDATKNKIIVYAPRPVVAQIARIVHQGNDALHKIEDDKRLETPITLDGKPTTLAVLLNKLHVSSGLTFDTFWPELRAIGITEETSVYLPAGQAPLRQVLPQILDVLQRGRADKLDYVVIQGTVDISSQQGIATFLANRKASLEQFYDGIARVPVPPPATSEPAILILDRNAALAAGAAPTSQPADGAAAKGIGVPPADTFLVSGGTAAKLSAGDEILTALEKQRLELQQDRAAEMAKAPPSKPRLMELDSRIAEIDKQIADEKVKTKIDALAAAERKKADEKTEIYDVHDLVGDQAVGPDTSAQRAALDELARAVSQLIAPAGTAAPFNQMLLVSGPAETQDRVKILLQRLSEAQMQRRKAMAPNSPGPEH